MSKYAAYSPDEQEELLSSFLIDSWSYSKVNVFARNEKEFEKVEIYREKSKRSASSVAGNAYHSALQYFFNELSNGVILPLIDLQSSVFTYIENIGANEWKIQKTTPTIEECILKANKMATTFITNFYKQKDIYTSDIDKILGVELSCEEWLTINGVDIPLPCHANIDLVLRLKDGRIVIIDHKSKTQYTDEQELMFSCGKQAITYIKSYEQQTGCKVDEVWFIENKESTNKDGSPQLKKFAIILDDNTRKLYEALLYEPLKKMLEATSDPDYVYTINDSDNMADKAELYQFWAKTMIAEVDDFDIPESKKELISRRQKKIRDANLKMINPKTITSFKKNAEAFITYDYSDKNMTRAEKIEHILRTFSIITKVAYSIEGYSSDTFLLECAAGVKMDRILKFKMDIANALNVPSIRIGDKLMMYEGKSYLYIEAPREDQKMLKWDKSLVEGYKIPIGKDNFQRTVFWNLENHSTPHMLICGATGSGKSVSIKSTIEYAIAAGIKDIVIFDPKYEFTNYSRKAKVYNDIEEIEEQMKLLVKDMQSRVKSGINNFKLVVFDEFADAVAAARKDKQLDIKEEQTIGFTAKGTPKTKLVVIGREKSLEENLKILLQKGRSLGFRIVAATQRASTQVITGDAKVNFPVQVCFRVPKEVDSKVVIDEIGAESLRGKGDGLMRSPEYLDLVRFQGFFKK